MKKTLIICLLILSNSILGQIPGKSMEGPIVLFDTLAIKQGDIIHLGKGSDPDTGNFVHLYIPKNKTVNTLYNIFSNNDDLSHKAIPQRNLYKDFADRQLVITSFSKVTSKKTGKIILGVIDMKKYQFVEGVFFNDCVVDLELAIRSGEILKISTPELTKKEAPEVELLFSPFEMTPKGIAPVVVAINNLSRFELYNKTLDWTNSFYNIPNQAIITAVPDEKITINDFVKNVQFGTIMGMDLFADLPYLLEVDFTDGEIKMTYTLGDENGDITDQNGEVIANASPSSIFNKDGEVRTMSQVFKAEAERVMNDLSYALVDYLLK